MRCSLSLSTFIARLLPLVGLWSGGPCRFVSNRPFTSHDLRKRSRNYANHGIHSTQLEYNPHADFSRIMPCHNATKPSKYSEAEQHRSARDCQRLSDHSDVSKADRLLLEGSQRSETQQP